MNLACRRMSQRALMAVSQVHAGFLGSNWLVLTRTGSCWLSRWLALALPTDKTIVWGWPDSPSRFRSGVNQDYRKAKYFLEYSEEIVHPKATNFRPIAPQNTRLDGKLNTLSNLVNNFSDAYLKHIGSETHFPMLSLETVSYNSD